MNTAMDILDQSTKEVAGLKSDNERLRVYHGIPLTQDEDIIMEEEEFRNEEPVSILNMFFDAEEASDSSYIPDEEEEVESSESDSESDIEVDIPLDEVQDISAATWKAEQLNIWGANIPKDRGWEEDPAGNIDDLAKGDGKEPILVNTKCDGASATDSHYVLKEFKEQETGDEINILNMKCDEESASDSSYNLDHENEEGTADKYLETSSTSSSSAEENENEDEDEDEQKLDSKEAKLLREDYHTALNTLLTPEYMSDRIIKQHREEPERALVLHGGDDSSSGSPTWAVEFVGWPEDEEERDNVMSDSSAMDWTEVCGKYDIERAGHESALNQENLADL